MLKADRTFIQVIAFAVVGILFIAAFSTRDNARPPVIVADDPLNATFVIGPAEVTLSEGTSEIFVEDSETTLRTRVFGEPVQGDLDEDGLLDTVLMIMHEAGGSGPLYFVAAVMSDKEGYIATNVIHLGDQVAPQNLRVENGLIMANYAMRKSDAAVTQEPTVAKTLYITYDEGQLTALDELDEGQMVMSGYYIMGHEVRQLQTCGGEEYYIHGDSPVYEDMRAVYNTLTVGQHPYIPQFVIVVATIVDTPDVGFAEGYDNALLIDRVVRYPLVSSCRPDTIVINEPKPATIINSPLRVSGYARGTWFFEGDFPVILTDWDGRIIAEHYVTALSDWMTEDFVRFEGTIDFEIPDGERGALILQKDNPSGLPQFDDALEIPIWYR